MASGYFNFSSLLSCKHSLILFNFWLVPSYSTEILSSSLKFHNHLAMLVLFLSLVSSLSDQNFLFDWPGLTSIYHNIMYICRIHGLTNHSMRIYACQSLIIVQKEFKSSRSLYAYIYDSRHARLNSHYKIWVTKKRRKRGIANRKADYKEPKGKRCQSTVNLKSLR